jgi:hypothetical protein
MQELFCQRIRNSTGLAIFAGLAVLATVAGAERSYAEIQREKAAEEDDQQAQQNVSLATSQGSALETELKKTQERAQLAEKNADLTARKLSAAETALAEKDEQQEAELKRAEERAQLAEKNADLAASQRSVLEAELKKAQDKAQLAEKNADLAASRCSALETELKKAQDKAQLAEKNADLAANQPKSGQTQPPDTGPKVEPLALTQPLDSSAQSAGATAPIAVEASPTPKIEPVTRDQQPVKLARINQSQSAVPLPTPSVAASTQSTPPEAQTDRNVQTSVEGASLKEFVLEYIRKAANDDVATQERFFEHKVNYYGEGVISLPRVKASLEHYRREWPIRNWEPQGEPEFPKTLHSANPKLYEVLQPFTWTLSNGPRHEQGSATLYLRIWKNDKSEFHIVHVEQRNSHPQSQNN